VQINVRHETRYRYHRPVALGRHHLVLRPRESHELALLDYRLQIEPAHSVSWLRDAHDNIIAMVDFQAPAATLTIVNEFRVQRIEPFPLTREQDLVRIAWPVPYDRHEAPLLDGYRRGNYPDDLAAVQAWTATHLPAAAPLDAWSTVLALCTAVHGTVSYRRRLEHGVQTPALTLEVGSGSCRDLATLLIEAARSRGFAARFASGYLHGTASVAGRASTHAWAEIYLPGMGWHGLDPTLGAPTDLRHIVIGVSHHPRGVMPVSGTFEGTCADLLEHTVSVQTGVPLASAPAA
jgi:transglutaminase-like putative cysteine protease